MSGMGSDPGAESLATDDELDAGQLAAMDALWRAQRAGQVSPVDADAIELTIRRGHIHGARKRLTEARRSGDSAQD